MSQYNMPAGAHDYQHETGHIEDPPETEDVISAACTKPRGEAEAVKRAAVARFRDTPRRVSVSRDAQYRAWLRDTRCCLICARLTRPAWSRLTERHGWLMRGVIAAHTSGNGRSSKGPDTECVPLCTLHHDEYDGRRPIAGETERNHAAFERHYGVDMVREGQAHFALFQLALENGAHAMLDQL